MKLFHRLLSFFAPLWTTPEWDLYHELLYQLRYDAFDEDALQAWNDHIRKCLLGGYHIEIRELKEQIPDGYAGIVTRLREGKLVCQRGLQIQEGYGGRKHICFCEIPPTVQTEFPSGG
jgi:hypothetical protein